jgi:hypothetical protein
MTMRTLTTVVLATLLVASCIESNPQPAPGRGDNEDPTYEGAEDTNKRAPGEGDAAWDGAVDLGAIDVRPEPADLVGEVTDAILKDVGDIEDDGGGEIPWYPTDGGEQDLLLDVDDMQAEELPEDLHATPDEMTEEITIGDSQLRGGGSYFGECFGACKMDVTIDGDQVNFVASNWDGTQYVDNDGTLTEAGLAKSKELAAALVGVELEDVYGCPDCDDGGGTYVLLRRNGVDSKHDYPFGQPFTALTNCDAFISELKTAMAGCQSTDNITVGEDCGPLG